MRKEPKLQFLVDMDTRVRATMEKIYEVNERHYGTTEKSEWTPSPVAIIPRLSPYVPSLRQSSTASSEILYTQDKELMRSVAGRKLIYAFMNKKRAAVLEHLLEADEQHVPTTTLISVSKSPNANALRKLIQGINTAARNKLKIKERLIVGRQGFGYAINANLSVIKA